MCPLTYVAFSSFLMKFFMWFSQLSAHNFAVDQFSKLPIYPLGEF